MNIYETKRELKSDIQTWWDNFVDAEMWISHEQRQLILRAIEAINVEDELLLRGRAGALTSLLTAIRNEVCDVDFQQKAKDLVSKAKENFELGFTNSEGMFVPHYQ
jgi:hypothetical protein